jgi:hypothetical protein
MAMAAVIPVTYYSPLSMPAEVGLYLSSSWIATILALSLSVVLSRWYLIVPAAYDGVKLKLRETRRFSKPMWSHILIWAVIIVLLNIFYSFEIIRDFYDLMFSAELDADGEILFNIENPLQVTLGIFMSAVIKFLCALYFLFVSSYAFCHIYQWCSQNAK